MLAEVRIMKLFIVYLYTLYTLSTFNGVECSHPPEGSDCISDYNNIQFNWSIEDGKCCSCIGDKIQCVTKDSCLEPPKNTTDCDVIRMCSCDWWICQEESKSLIHDDDEDSDIDFFPVANLIRKKRGSSRTDEDTQKPQGKRKKGAIGKKTVGKGKIPPKPRREPMKRNGLTNGGRRRRPGLRNGGFKSPNSKRTRKIKDRKGRKNGGKKKSKKGQKKGKGESDKGKGKGEKGKGKDKKGKGKGKKDKGKKDKGKKENQSNMDDQVAFYDGEEEYADQYYYPGFDYDEDYPDYNYDYEFFCDYPYHYSDYYNDPKEFTEKFYDKYEEWFMDSEPDDFFNMPAMESYYKCHYYCYHYNQILSDNKTMSSGNGTSDDNTMTPESVSPAAISPNP